MVSNEPGMEIRKRLRWFDLDRRDFLKLCGGGLLICFVGAGGEAQESGRFREHTLPNEIGAWIHIDEHGKVTVFTGKVEIGQNIRTSLAQLVAQELRVPFDQIGMVMGDTDLTPWDMGTFGSRSTPTMGPQLRNMASAARQMLIETAARRWNVDPATLKAANGSVTNPRSGQSLTYGEITGGEKLTQVIAADPLLTPPKDWSIAGAPESKVDGREFVSGKHVYPSDVVRPGMMIGKVLRPSGFNAKLISVDTGPAEKMAEVKVVRDGDFTGVVAPDAWTAEKAISAIEAKWDVPPQISNRELFEYLRNNPDKEDEAQQNATGLDRAAARPIEAEVKLDQHYTVEYIAHAPLEPRAAVAEWRGDKLTVWTGTQRPFGVRDELADTFRIPGSKVRVIMPDMGSGYGGKHSGECAIEAARLAKAVGKPVKLVWTREEEFTWAYFRPAGWIEIRSGATREGKLVAWECHNYNSGPSAIDSPYNVPNQVAQYHAAKSPLRQGSYRGLAATANHFARESHMDELAHEIGLDPLEFRLRNLTDSRLRAVFEAAAERFGWGRKKPESGFGVAGGVEKGGYVATCAEVDVDAKSKTIKLRRIVQAWESGAIVNPNGLRNQIMGAVVQAMGGALFEAIQFRDGRILNPHFAQYRVPRFADMPNIDVVLIDRKDIPSAGAGEIGIVGLAPAIGNAIFAATGTRLRKMPMEL